MERRAQESGNNKGEALLHFSFIILNAWRYAASFSIFHFQFIANSFKCLDKSLSNFFSQF